MITPVAQRWRDHRDSYRPAGEVIRTNDYEVVALADNKTAKAFVLRHHYSRRFPSSRFRFALYCRGELAGVAVFGVGANPAVTKPFSPDDAVELSRFVLLDNVACNGESWFIARCFELLRREHLAAVVSFSDPEPRTDSLGRRIFPGHVGTIYQATNATYTGRARARTKWLLPDGTFFEERAKSKIIALDSRLRSAAAPLIAAGAPPVDESDPRGWVERAIAQVTRPMKHPGNHRYIFALDRRARRHLPVGLPYPKFSPRSAT